MLLHPPTQPLDQVAPLVFLWVVAYGSLSIGFAWDYRLGSCLGQNRAHLVAVVGFVCADRLGRAGEFEKAVNGASRPTCRILDWFHIAMKFRAIDLTARKHRDLSVLISIQS